MVYFIRINMTLIRLIWHCVIWLVSLFLFNLKTFTLAAYFYLHFLQVIKIIYSCFTIKSQPFSSTLIRILRSSNIRKTFIFISLWEYLRYLCFVLLYVEYELKYRLEWRYKKRGKRKQWWGFGRGTGSIKWLCPGPKRNNKQRIVPHSARPSREFWWRCSQI